MSKLHADVVCSIRALVLSIEALFPAARRRIAIREEINKLGLRINLIYENATNRRPVRQQTEIDRKIQPFQCQIELLRAEDRALDTEAHRIELVVHEALRELARHCGAAMPQLEQFPQVWASRGSPIDHLLKLKSLLSTAVQSAMDESNGCQIAVPTEAKSSQPRGLETHRRRIETLDRISEEFAAIHRETRTYTTLAKLKQKFPHFRLWRDLSLSEQQELLEEPFKPKAYAASITLRLEGLTSRESLRYSRRALRKHSKSENS